MRPWRRSRSGATGPTCSTVNRSRSRPTSPSVSRANSRGAPAIARIRCESRHAFHWAFWFAIGELQFGVGRVAFSGESSQLADAYVEFLRTQVLAGGRACQPRDVLFHQCAAVIVGARTQAELCHTAIQLDPRDLNIPDGAGQQQPRQRMNLEMFCERRPGPRDALLIEQRVLVHESQGNELREAFGFAL